MREKKWKTSQSSNSLVNAAEKYEKLFKPLMPQLYVTDTELQDFFHINYDETSKGENPRVTSINEISGFCRAANISEFFIRRVKLEKLFS